MKIVSLNDCKKCHLFGGMYKDDIIRCKRIECNSLVFIQPSFYNEGFDNGVLVVRCLNT